VVAQWVALAVGAVMLAALVARTLPPRPLPAGVRADVDRDFTAEQQARAAAYQRATRPLGILAVLISSLWILVLGFTSLGSDWMRSVGTSAWAQVVLGLGAILVMGRLLTLPTSIRGRMLALRAGLATGSWRSWAWDQAKGLAVSLVLALAAAGGLVWVMGLLPQSWWWVAAVAAVALVVLLSFVLPVLVEPLFLRFRPLAPGEQRHELLALGERAEVEIADVLVADASRRTTALNAYVSGFGATRRVVVFDTLVERAPAGEVEVVVAHELGHVVHRDVAVGTAIAAVAAGLGVVALSLALSWGWLLERAGAAYGPTMLPLALALGTLAGLVASPLQAALSRRVEAHADRFALELASSTADPATVAATYSAMQRRLALDNLAPLRPNRLLYVWFATHPSVPERLALTRDWLARRD
jgi:STE24 endopeptidase